MTMSYVWLVLTGTSLLCAILNGKANALSSAVLSGANDGIRISIALAGSLCLWSGVGHLLGKSGISSTLSRILRPLMQRIFPSSRTDPALANDLSGNICANLLGLGNAATPMGIRAACRLKDPANPNIATDEMCRLIVLNTASIQLIPGNVAAIRASAGAAAPFDLLLPVWITSACSACAGLFAANMLRKVWSDD